VKAGIPIDTAVVQEPAGALPKADPVGNLCEKEQQGGAKRFVRRKGDGEIAAAQLRNRAPESFPTPARPLLIVYNNLVEIRIALEQALCLGGAQNRHLGVGKTALGLGQKRSGQNNVAQKTGLDNEDLFHSYQQLSALSRQLKRRISCRLAADADRFLDLDRLVDQHNRDVVLDGIEQAARVTHEAIASGSKVNVSLALGTGQDIQQILTQRHKNRPPFEARIKIDNFSKE
jgi:hypothetical protein